MIDVALGRLSEERRAMLLLRPDHDFAYEQIAELMGITLAKVKVGNSSPAHRPARSDRAIQPRRPDVIPSEQDESLERELFALRARALPEPAFDVAAVMIRVRRREQERAARARVVVWIGAATCAAASLVLAVPTCAASICRTRPT